MIPANHRSIARPASHTNICTAALYSVAGVCRCPKCAPNLRPPMDDLSGQPAAAPTFSPYPTGGGTFDHTSTSKKGLK